MRALEGNIQSGWSGADIQSRPGSGRVLPRLVVVLLLMVTAGIGLAGSAAAHDVLIGSDPAEGATLTSAPSAVRLTFDQPVQNFEPIVTVLGPDGQRYENGSPQVDSTVVTAAVTTLATAGAYVIAYRVVSADGHPVQGEVHFQFAPPSGVVGSALPTGSAGAGATAGTSSEPSATSSALASTSPTATTNSAVAPTSSSSGISGWVWAAIAIAAVLVVAAIAVAVRRPRPPG